jgi:hypothetical protein
MRATDGMLRTETAHAGTLSQFENVLLFIIWRNEIAPVTIKGRAEPCFDQECRGCCKTIAEKR